MKRAYVGIRAEPHYRRSAFVSGLRAVGYDVRLGPPQTWDAETVYVTWNRYGSEHEICSRLERAGGVCLIAENAFLGPNGVSPHQMEPREWYALAIGGHNGSGSWHVGGAERWEALGVELQPWRTEGEHILVCPNRSFGRPDLIMPLGWERKVAEALRKVTDRPIRIRPHPGNNPKHKVPLADDLAGAWACVIWSSSAGVQALVAGVPVICDGPAWIGKPGTLPLVDCGAAIDDPRFIGVGADTVRSIIMERLAWAQWHVSEIATGEPFAHLLHREATAA